MNIFSYQLSYTEIDCSPVHFPFSILFFFTTQNMPYHMNCETVTYTIYISRNQLKGSLGFYHKDNGLVNNNF